MAVAVGAVAASRARRRGRKDDLDHTLQEEVMPPESACVLTGMFGRKVIGTLGMSWQKRVARLTKDHLYIGKIGEEIALDSIYLDEVTAVKELDDPREDKQAGDDEDEEDGDSDAEDFRIMAIHTHDEHTVHAIDRVTVLKTRVLLPRDGLCCIASPLSNFLYFFFASDLISFPSLHEYRAQPRRKLSTNG